MTTNQLLSLFISSKMAELAEERHAVQSALSAYQMRGWLFEKDAGARPEPIQSTYLTEVEACDIYIGLFWQGYGPYTIEEYEQARALHKPCLVYEKHVDIDKRDPQLGAFLKGIQRVTDPLGLTVSRFESVETLREQVQRDVLHLLITTFRQSRQQPPPVQVWNVPFRRNPFFTGREQLLTQLYENLTQTGAAALTQAQAISGLGGIGRTQTAVEYAYRYRDEYQAILWVSAATQNTLMAGFVILADVLDLPEKNEQDQNITVLAVKRWLEQHAHWLLMLDNADDLDVVEEFIPTGGKGHILLTTRIHAPGALARSMEVQQMDRDEGSLLLLRRARILEASASLDQAPPQERISAEAIVIKMDGLPLALDQAGAYMEETQCGLATYLDRYRQHQGMLLQRRGQSRGAHPDPVASTWALSFVKVEEQNKASADLLRLCAFLAPDAIPEELISEGARELGPQLEPLAEHALLFDEAVGTLLRYSLVRRDQQDNTLAIHRLVQAVLKTSLDETVQQLWAERAVKALNQTFPAVEYATWPQCKRLITQAQACADLMRAYHLSFPAAANLLNRAGWYLRDHAQFRQAEPLLQQSISIYEGRSDAEGRAIGSPLNNLAEFYRSQGKYDEALPLHQRALAIREQELGPMHPSTANSLWWLATLYEQRKAYEQAEPLYRRAVAIYEQVVGSAHPSTENIRARYAALLQQMQQEGEKD